MLGGQSVDLIFGDDFTNFAVFSLREDLSRVNEELDESQGLVKSLKSELALYEKYYRNEGGAGILFLRHIFGHLHG